MRILVLQLARFGDIYQTWPTLKALRRQHPEAELHVLVRHRFREALSGLDGLHIHIWPTADILAPIYLEGDEQKAANNLATVLAPLQELKFDQVINLSFSPVSSYLTDILAEDCAVTGYTRHSDGYLKIPDDASAYFFAQGEIGQSNRFHITQIFALVAQVELHEEDFCAFSNPSERKNQVIVHLGASQSLRLYPAEKWVSVLQAALAATSADWILIGSPDEKALADTVCAQVQNARLRNQVGQTRLPELMQVLVESKLFVGCDSAPAQMASLTQTPVLQLTSNTANFWTTGPTSAGSRVIYAPDLHSISVDRVVQEAIAMLNGEAPRGACALRTSALEPYALHELSFDSFSWHLIEAIYTQTDYPATTREEDLLTFQRLFELSELALSQMDGFAKGHPTAATILANVDQMLKEVARLNPRTAPLLQWFETERLRMPPGPLEQTIASTQKLFADLLTISSVYRRYAQPDQEMANAVSLCRKCVPAIREFQMNQVQDEFQRLLSTLHELSRHSTKVGAEEWSTLLGGLNQALDRRDLIEVADQLEYVLIPALS